MREVSIIENHSRRLEERVSEGPGEEGAGGGRVGGYDVRCGADLGGGLRLGGDEVARIDGEELAADLEGEGVCGCAGEGGWVLGVLGEGGGDGGEDVGHDVLGSAED